SVIRLRSSTVPFRFTYRRKVASVMPLLVAPPGSLGWLTKPPSHLRTSESDRWKLLSIGIPFLCWVCYGFRVGGVDFRLLTERRRSVRSGAIARKARPHTG